MQDLKLKGKVFKPTPKTKYYLNSENTLIACELGKDEYDPSYCFELKIVEGQLQAFITSNDLSKLHELPVITMPQRMRGD